MMETVNLCERPSLVGHLMRQLRDTGIQRDRMRFRANVRRLGQMMAYEVSKRLRYEPTVTKTPLAKSDTCRIADDLVIATILRAGLALHEGFLSYFDEAESAFVSACREYAEDGNDFDVRVEYLACPDIEGKTLIITDPMLATGRSMELAYRALLTRGVPARIHVASIIATDQAIAHVARFLPEERSTLWACDIDHTLNEHSYIVPGLGDAGDLLYGTKL